MEWFAKRVRALKAFADGRLVQKVTENGNFFPVPCKEAELKNNCTLACPFAVFIETSGASPEICLKCAPRTAVLRADEVDVSAFYA